MAEEQEHEHENESSEPAAADPPVSDAVADDVGDAEPAPAPSPEPAPPAEALHPKEARRRARARRSGPARDSLTPEERQAERAKLRARKAQLRRQGRAKARAKARSAAPAGSAETEPRPASHAAAKVRQGVVISDKAEKTITVRIDTSRRHRRYSKIVRSSKTLHAHDERNEAREGDLVRLVETRPLSRTKRWRLTEVLEKAR